MINVFPFHPSFFPFFPFLRDFDLPRRDAQFIDLLCHGLCYITGISRPTWNLWNNETSNQCRTYHGSHVYLSRWCLILLSVFLFEFFPIDHCENKKSKLESVFVLGARVHRILLSNLSLMGMGWRDSLIGLKKLVDTVDGRRFRCYTYHWNIRVST